MSSITCFDDLPDLVLIELLSYLSSVDVMWGFTRLNHRLTMLISERGFFDRLNLSSARYHQFQTILRFLPLNRIHSLTIDGYASPFQLARWPYLPRLRTLCIIDVWNADELLLFIILHAATLTHLIIRTNERSLSDGLTMKLAYPIGDMVMLINNILFVHLPALRSLDLGVGYYGTYWPFTTAIVPLTYLRLHLPSMQSLVKLMSTPPLSNTLRHLHVEIGNSYWNRSSRDLVPTVSIQMANLHTFTLVQTFFCTRTMEWTLFEWLTSSNVMPALQRANIAFFVNINDFNRIRSAPLFADHRHVIVNFAFSLISCPQYTEVTRFIPCGSRFYPREIVGVTFMVNTWSERSKWLATGDPYNRERDYYHHHMWYTLPWAFDEFFHEYIPDKWITNVHVFHTPSQTMITVNKSSLSTLDASGQTLASCLMSLPHVVLDDRVETLHLSFYNQSINVKLFNLRTITLVNSTNCLNCCSQFPRTIRSVRILLFFRLPNYMLPNWPVVLDSLSALPQRISLRIFIYDLLKTVDDYSCRIIAEVAHLFNDFSFCFRHKFSILEDENLLVMVFEDHANFIKQLCHRILMTCGDKRPLYSIEDDGCGLTMWS